MWYSTEGGKKVLLSDVRESFQRQHHEKSANKADYSHEHIILNICVGDLNWNGVK